MLLLAAVKSVDSCILSIIVTDGSDSNWHASTLDFVDLGADFVDDILIHSGGLVDSIFEVLLVTGSGVGNCLCIGGSSISDEVGVFSVQLIHSGIMGLGGSKNRIFNGIESIVVGSKQILLFLILGILLHFQVIGVCGLVGQFSSLLGNGSDIAVVSCLESSCFTLSFKSSIF